jgi:hypothetical protein
MASYSRDHLPRKGKLNKRRRRKRTKEKVFGRRGDEQRAK